MKNNINVRKLFVASVLALFFGVLCGILHSLLSFNTSSKYGSDTAIVERLVIDTFTSDPKIEYFKETIHDTVWPSVKIDTQAIIANYFSLKTYERVYTDTNCIVSINDTVNQNSLIPGKISVTSFQKTYIIDRTITRIVKPKYSIDLGAQMTNTGSAISLGIGWYSNQYKYSVGPVFGTYKGIYVQASKTFNQK